MGKETYELKNDGVTTRVLMRAVMLYMCPHPYVYVLILLYICAAHARRRLPDTQLVKNVGFPSAFQGVVKIDEIVDAKGSAKKH